MKNKLNSLEVPSSAPIPKLEQALEQSQPTQPEARGVVLGEPMNIRDVAQLIGCSPWTVRQKHIPNGLPHFRSTAGGRLIFYRDQIVRWILQKQKKGGSRL